MNIKGKVKKHKKGIIIGSSILGVIVLLVAMGTARKNDLSKQEEADKFTEELLSQAQGGSGNSDNLVLQMQPELEKTFGKAPDGFVWETDGSAISLGDKNMTSEEVVYAYMRGLTTLDMGTVERYSRDSTVVDNYSSYFDENNKNTDYMDQFIRNMYKQCLLSIQVLGIDSKAVFAKDKQVYTVKAKMLDLTDKDFWKNDSEDIYKNLYLYESDESDTAKADIYLYDYILGYYKSDEAQLKDVTFDLTLQKYPDLDTGWLVSIDTDIDDACQYKDGKLVVSYIKDQYRTVGRELLMEQERIKAGAG